MVPNASQRKWTEVKKHVIRVQTIVGATLNFGQGRIEQQQSASVSKWLMIDKYTIMYYSIPE